MKKGIFPRIISFVMMFIMLVGVVPVLSVSAGAADVAETAETIPEGIKYSITDNKVEITDYTGTASSLTIPSTIEGYPVIYIGDEAFNLCTSLKNIVISEGIESIGYKAFGNCMGLKSITIPSSLTSIGNYAFTDCIHLESVSLSENLESIGDYAFADCYSLVNVEISEGTESIGEYAFNYCDALASVTIPASVTYIGSQAFGDCLSLTDVYFGGTKEQWNEVFVGDGNEYLLNATIHFDEESETDPTEPEVLPEQGIGMGSEVLTDVKVGDKIRYTARFSAERLFENFEATLTYNAECLELATLYNEGGEELTDMYEIGAVMCPNLCSPFVNSTNEGVVRLFDINLDGNDFAEEKVLLTMEFIVKDTAYSEIKLTIDEMTILGGEEDYFTDGEAVITEGVSLTESVEVTAKAETDSTEPEETKVYTVVFLDYDSKFIDVQIVKEGEGAVAPADPTRSGHTFSGWDTEFENVTSNIIVKATYTKIPTPPAQTPATGSLKIEVAGGKGFSISMGGGAFRTQGSSYMNSQAPIGEIVAVKANAVSDSTFIGWINPITGIVVSTELEYTFTASGNDFLKAMYTVKIDGVQMVTFKNDKAQRILDSQYYTQDEAIQFPVAPTQVGFDFAGWSMTEAEIQSAIANGQDVTVVAKWTKALVPVEVTVVGGTGSGTYYANNAVTVTAHAAESGKKFAYWTDEDGNIRSYNAEYTFFPSKDTTVIAVFVDEDTVIDYQILVSLDSIDTATVADKNVFTYSWYCPEEYTFVKAGIVAVNKDNYNESTFVAGSADSNVYDRSPSGDELIPVNTFTWTKSNVTSGQTWMAKAYVQYRDADGNIVTVYSDVVEATKD